MPKKSTASKKKPEKIDRNPSTALPDGRSAQDDNGKEYEIGSWSGMPQYRCKKCPFDTLSMPKMEEHLALHRPPVERKIPSVFVADKRGRDVTLDAPLPVSPKDGGKAGEIVEVELVEVSSTTDENGVEHKVFTAKE